MAEGKAWRSSEVSFISRPVLPGSRLIGSLVILAMLTDEVQMDATFETKCVS